MADRPPRWAYSEADLTSAVAMSRSYRQVLANLGLATQGGGAYTTIQKRIRLLGLDTSHFTGQGWNCRTFKGARPGRRPIPLDVALTTDSPVTNYVKLKRRLIREGVLLEKCAICGMDPIWQGQALVLRLDHINGTRTDNRIENLRLVCPNCDSQLPTFAGRNRRKGRVTPPSHCPQPLLELSSL